MTPIVSLEIGTTRVRALVGEACEDGSVLVTGVGEGSSRGVRKGEIIDFDNALACVREALNMAEEQSDVSIRSVYLLVSGDHILSTVNRGTVPVLDSDREITAQHVEAAARAARVANLSEDREVIHTINQQFYVDDQEGVLNPEGMEGSQLALSVLVVHGNANRLRNTIKVVQNVPLNVEDVAFSGLCSALSVLTPEQKESGTLVIDMGGGTTDVFMYAPRYPAFAMGVGVGGDHVTNDIAIGLRLPTRQAEWLKREHGSALIDHSRRAVSVAIPPEGGIPGRTLKLADLHTIVNARAEETFALIYEQLERRSLLHQVGAGVVLTGGGSSLRGVTALAEKVFNMPAVIGMPRGISGLNLACENSAFSAGTGMLRFGLMNERKRQPMGLKSIFKSFLGR